MANWTHPICQADWDRTHPDREPVRLRREHRDPEICCFCGKPTIDGIYVREDPGVLTNCSRAHDKDAT